MFASFQDFANATAPQSPFVDVAAALETALQVSGQTFKADREALRGPYAGRPVPDHVRMACVYRAQAHDLLQAAADLLQAAEVAAGNGDLAMATRHLLDARGRTRAVFGGGR